MNAAIATTFSTESSCSQSGVVLGYDRASASVDGVVRMHRFHQYRERNADKGTRQWRVVRRLRGLMLANQGDKWLVGFGVKGELVEYELPAARLRKHGIKMRYQPFEPVESAPLRRTRRQANPGLTSPVRFKIPKTGEIKVLAGHSCEDCPNSQS